MAMVREDWWGWSQPLNTELTQKQNLTFMQNHHQIKQLKTKQDTQWDSLNKVFIILFLVVCMCDKNQQWDMGDHIKLVWPDVGLWIHLVSMESTQVTMNSPFVHMGHGTTTFCTQQVASVISLMDANIMKCRGRRDGNGWWRTTLGGVMLGKSVVFCKIMDCKWTGRLGSGH